MKRYFLAFMLLFSLSSMVKAACNDMTIVQNGCFLEIYCVNGGVPRLEANLHLNSLTYVQTGSTTFVLEDNADRSFAGDVNHFAAYATVADVFTFVGPLRDGCQGGGGGSTTVNSTDFEFIQRCDDNGAFWYKISKTGTAADVVTTVTATGAAYTPVGTIIDCAVTDCTSSNEQGVTEIINGTATFAAATYHSISLVVYEGTATVTVGTGAPITIAAGTPGLAWSAKECELLAFNVVINATGGGSVRVAHIQ